MEIETENVISLFVGFTGVYFWLYDRRCRKKATLYYPLYFACEALISSLSSNDKIDSGTIRHNYISAAKVLQDIIYNYGSIIYLRASNDFFSMVKLVNKESALFEQNEWKETVINRLKSEAERKKYLKTIFSKDNFQEINRLAKKLLLECEKNIK